MFGNRNKKIELPEKPSFPVPTMREGFFNGNNNKEQVTVPTVAYSEMDINPIPFQNSKKQLSLLRFYGRFDYDRFLDIYEDVKGSLDLLLLDKGGFIVNQNGHYHQEYKKLETLFSKEDIYLRFRGFEKEPVSFKTLSKDDPLYKELKVEEALKGGLSEDKIENYINGKIKEMKLEAVDVFTELQVYFMLDELESVEDLILTALSASNLKKVIKE